MDSRSELVNLELDRKTRASQAGNSSRVESPARLLRSVSLILLLGCVVAVGLSFNRADEDVKAEMESAMAVARVVALAQSSSSSPQALVEALREAVAQAPLRHLRVSLRDEEGRAVLSARQIQPSSIWLEPLVALQRRWQPLSDPPPLVVHIPWPGGAEWSLVITPDPDSERRESVKALVQSSAVVALASVALLGLLWRQIRRLRRVERERRMLSLRLQSSQEEERRRMAQELHDELGQRLMALRLEATVLQRRLTDRPHDAQLAAALGAQVQSAQQEVSDLLRRLAPRTDYGLPVQRLRELIEELAAPVPHGDSIQIDLQFPDTRSASGGPPCPDHRLQTDEDTLSEALLMALFRMSQEALTNVKRHSKAREVRLSIHRDGLWWHWRCEDDGVGLNEADAAQRRGNGLAGLRERAWAFGGDLQILPRPGGGLVLSASLRDQKFKGQSIGEGGRD